MNSCLQYSAFSYPCIREISILHLLCTSFFCALTSTSFSSPMCLHLRYLSLSLAFYFFAFILSVTVLSPCLLRLLCTYSDPFCFPKKFIAIVPMLAQHLSSYLTSSPYYF